MNAYQNFLDFFSIRGLERLDGLSDSYFTAMTLDEKGRAFDYLMARVEQGGSEESVHALFKVDSRRAVAPIRQLLDAGTLNHEAQIAAAWNLWHIQEDDHLLAIFIHFLASPQARLREQAACYLPVVKFTNTLKAPLKKMIRGETERLARIHAVDKLLAGYGVSAESVGEEKYLRIYRDLHSEDSTKQEAVFKELDMFEALSNLSLP